MECSESAERNQSYDHTALTLHSTMNQSALKLRVRNSGELINRLKVTFIFEAIRNCSETCISMNTC